MKITKYSRLAVVPTIVVMMGVNAALAEGLHQGRNDTNTITKPPIDMVQPTDYETASFGLG